ncbi:hypothetical protein ACIBQ0_30635 [Nocardia nova]|uniref:hypothetical protein n=1 Tax=Nocardia nova TaxID=37330 RepID=UPI0037B1A8F7
MGYWFVAMVFLWGGVGGLPLSAKGARFGLRFARDGIVVAGRIVDVERGHRAVLDRNGTETIVEYSSPVVAFRTADCREMREAAIIARARTMARPLRGPVRRRLAAWPLAGPDADAG